LRVRWHITAALGHALPLMILGDGRFVQYSKSEQTSAQQFLLIVIDALVCHRKMFRRPILNWRSSRSFKRTWPVIKWQHGEQNRLLNALHWVGLNTKPNSPEFPQRKPRKRTSWFDSMALVLFQKDYLDRGGVIEVGFCILVEHPGRWQTREILVAEQNHVVKQSETQ
jgi:hypothetical protein